MSDQDKFSFDFDDPQTVDTKQLSDDTSFDFEAPRGDDAPVSAPDTDLDLFLLHEEIVDQVEPDWMMECICPSCSGKTNIDMSVMPENKLKITCASCSKQMYVIRESGACRAKRKLAEMHCANCGNQLDHHVYCRTCGKSFPDYFIMVNPDEVRSKTRKNLYNQLLQKIAKFNVSFNPSFESTSHHETHRHSPVRHTTGSKPGLSSRRYLTSGISLVVLIMLLAGGMFAYNSYKIEKMYAENYIKTLYCIKTGLDANFKKCLAQKAEWESAGASGRNFTLGINALEEAKNVKLRVEIDKYLNTLAKTPKKYSNARMSLKNYHQVYLDTEMLLKERAESLSEFSSSIDTLDKKANQVKQEIKSDLPGQLNQELDKARIKYKSLKEF
jgi:hypothetical protein